MSLLKNSIYTIMAVALTLTSCNRQMIYSHYENIDSDGWTRDDCKDFYVAVKDKGTYTETLGLRTIGCYPYTNLTVIVTQQAQLSGIQRTDTLNITLTDDDGNELGQGTNYQQMDIALGDIELEADDSLFVSIRHHMSREVLPGIIDVGVSLEIED
jgi:gliding motility-associated lipoprotein GldH